MASERQWNEETLWIGGWNPLGVLSLVHSFVAAAAAASPPSHPTQQGPARVSLARSRSRDSHSIKHTSGVGG